MPSDRLTITESDLAEAADLAGLNALTDEVRNNLIAGLQLITENKKQDRTSEITNDLGAEGEAIISLEANLAARKASPHLIHALHAYFVCIQKLVAGKNVGTQMHYDTTGDLVPVRDAKEQLAIEIQGASDAIQQMSRALEEQHAPEASADPEARAAQQHLLYLLGSLVGIAHDEGITSGVGEIRSVRSDVQRRFDQLHKHEQAVPAPHRNRWTGTRGAGII